MSEQPIAINAASLLSARVMGALLAMAVLAVSAHQLSIGAFGLVTTVLAVGFLANAAVTFGTDTTLTRSTAAHPDGARGAARLVLRWQLSFSLGLIALTTVLAAADVVPVVLLVQAMALFPLAVITVAGAVLRGREQMTHLVGGGIIGGMVSLLATVVGFAFVVDPAVPVAALGLGAVATAMFIGQHAMRLIPADPAQTADPLRMRSLTAESIPFAAMVVLTALSTQGALLLVEFVADEPTGGYGVAARLLEAARLVPGAVVGALFPSMIVGRDSDDHQRWLRRLVGYAIAATIALMVFAGSINSIVFDDQPDGTILIRILALALLPIVARLFLSFRLIADGRERVVLWSAVAGFVCFVAAGIALSLHWGARGTAVAQLTGVAVSTMWLVVAQRRAGRGSLGGSHGEMESQVHHAQ